MLKLLERAPLAKVETPNIGLLTLAVAINSAATHIFLPGMPLAATEFGVSAATIQLTLTLSLLGVAFSDLISGPLSDRLGRRPVLLLGAALFTISSVAAALAFSATLLIMARLAQSFGSGASRVAGRAAARDNLPAERVAQKLVLLSMAQSVVPILSPAIGGFMIAAFGWRSVFVFCAALGLVAVTAMLLYLPETNRNRTTGPGFATMLASLAGLMRKRRYMGYALGCGLTNGSFFALSAGLPFILSERLHQTPEQIGLFFLGFTLGLFFGLTAAGWLVRRFQVAPIVLAGDLVALAGAGAFVGFCLADDITILTVIVPLVAFSFGCGLMLPTGMAGAMADEASRAGAAAGLFSFTIQLSAASSVVLGGLWFHTDLALATGLVLVLFTGVSCVILKVCRIV